MCAIFAEENIKKQRFLDQIFEDVQNSDVKSRNGYASVNPLIIIAAMPDDPKDLTTNDLIAIFENLSKEPISDEALLHANFDTLIDATKLILPQLSASQNAWIFNQIAQAEIPMFDELTEIVTDNLMKNVYHLSPDEMIDVDFALRKYYAKEKKISGKLELLRKTARNAFPLRLNLNLLEDTSYKQLMKIVRYLSNNSSLIANERDERNYEFDTLEKHDLDMLISKILWLDDHVFQMNDVVCVIVTLSRFPKLNEKSEKLLEKMFRIWCKSAKNFDDVDKILNLLVERGRLRYDSKLFSNPLFIEQCAQHTIKNNKLSDTLSILEAFIRLVS